MSAINQMLRDLDKRGALAGGAAAPGALPQAGAAAAATPNALAGAYARVRLLRPRWRLSRRVVLAGGVAALLPVAWAAWASTFSERPAAAPWLAWVAAPAVPPQAPATAAPVRVATAPALPAPAPAVQPVAAVATAAVPAPVAEAKPAPADVAVLPPVVPTTAVAEAAPQPAKIKPARAASAPPRSDPGDAVRADAPKDTRLAMASPAAPEARIERRPTDARDDLTRAGEAMSIGRTSDAIALLRKVIQAEPDNERARLALLSLLAERGRDDTWRSTLAESAQALPKRFGLAAAQGMAESGRFDQSLAILKSLPESVRDTRYFSALGATHQQLNQHAEAVVAFDAALGMAPGSSPQLPSLLVAQALSMQSLGQQAEARRNLERVRQMPEAASDVRDFANRELAHSR